jgi:hypothetical protein
MMGDILSALLSPMPNRHLHDEVRYLLVLAQGCRLAARRAPQSVGAAELIAKARRFEEFAELALPSASDHQARRSVQPIAPTTSQRRSNNVLTLVRYTTARIHRLRERRVRPGSMRQLAAVEVAATGHQIRGSE